MKCSMIGLIVTLALGLFCLPLAATAQRPGKVVRVGMLASSFPSPRSTPFFEAFWEELHTLGYVEGQNLALEFRTAEGQVERLPALAAELVRLPVDVLVAPGPEATLQAARQGTSTIPIVMVAIDYDPMARGYVAGLSRPGGNVTGVFFQQLELTGKRLELLKDAVPQMQRVAVLWDAFSADQFPAAAAAARGLGVQVHSLELRHPLAYDFAAAFSAAVQGRADALLVLASPLFYRERRQLTALALQHRLPSIAGSRDAAEAGALLAYGANLAHMYRRAASYVDKILKGATPADLPVEQPTKFELIINRKTAQALGITLPPSLLLLADEVIQ
jgi:putative ABC transport system substrate-binding protein